MHAGVWRRKMVWATRSASCGRVQAEQRRRRHVAAAGGQVSAAGPDATTMDAARTRMSGARGAGGGEAGVGTAAGVASAGGIGTRSVPRRGGGADATKRARPAIDAHGLTESLGGRQTRRLTALWAYQVASERNETFHCKNDFSDYFNTKNNTWLVFIRDNSSRAALPLPFPCCLAER